MPGALDVETLRAMGLVAPAAVPVAPAYAVEVPAPPPPPPPDEARRLAADPSVDLREAYRREQASQAPAVAAPAEDEDSDDSDDAPLESLITVRRRDDSSDDD